MTDSATSRSPITAQTLGGDIVKAILTTAIVMTLVRVYPRAFRRVGAARAVAPQRDPVRVP